MPAFGCLLHLQLARSFSVGARPLELVVGRRRPALAPARASAAARKGARHHTPQHCASRQLALCASTSANAAPSPANSKKIEVERKFGVSERDEARVRSLLRMRSEKSFTDVYFDAPGHGLTARDVWLRERSGVWELKRPAPFRAVAGLDQYEEIEGEAAVAEALGLRPPLPGALLAAGYESFATIVTRRQSFVPPPDEAPEGLTVVLDSMDFGYRILEIEVLSDPTPEALARASDLVSLWSRRLGLSPSPTPGKVLAFVERFRPAHHAALRASGLLASKLA